MNDWAVLRWICGVKPSVKLCIDFLYNRLGIAAISTLKRSRILRLDQPVSQFRCDRETF